jgi:hypothetical protein
MMQISGDTSFPVRGPLTPRTAPAFVPLPAYMPVSPHPSSVSATLITGISFQLACGLLFKFGRRRNLSYIRFVNQFEFALIDLLFD